MMRVCEWNGMEGGGGSLQDPRPSLPPPHPAGDPSENLYIKPSRISQASRICRVKASKRINVVCIDMSNRDLA